MVPEAAVAMLACARLGVIHTVIFGGFSSEAIKDRVNDCQAKVDHHGRRRLAPRQGRRAEDERRPRPRWHAHACENVVVLKRTGQELPLS